MRVYVDYWHRHDPFQSQVALIDFDTLERVATEEDWNEKGAIDFAQNHGWEVVEKPVDNKDWANRQIPQ